MKRILIGILALGLVSSFILASCGTDYSVGHGYYGNFTGVGASYLGHWWVAGNVSGKDSGTADLSATLFLAQIGHYQAGFGTAATLATNCPATTDILTVLYSQEVSAGTASHASQFALVSAPYQEGFFQFDLVNNGVATTMTGGSGELNQMPFQDVPKPRINGSTNNGNGTWTFQLNFDAPTYGHKQNGFYLSTSPPATSPIAGFKAFYHVGSAPTSSSPSDSATWTPVRGTWNDGVIDVASSADGASGAGNYAATVTWNGSSTVYFAYLMIFDSGYGTSNWLPYLSANSSQIGPTPAGVFASADASLRKGVVTVNFRTNVESGTANFQVLASKSDDPGSFAPVEGTLTQPKGNHSFYSVAFPNPYPGAKKFYVKVQSTDFDGQTYESNTVKITRKVAYKSGKEILLDDME